MLQQKNGSPCELWNDGKKIAELQSGTHQTVSIPSNAEEIIIKGYDIQKLDCNNNQLTALNASGCTRLQVLYCSRNKLTTLNVNGCTSLQWLDCNNNKLSAEVLKKLFEDFPERKWNYGIKREQPQKRGNI
ncbi:hypothetical protein TPHV1_150080 [Treponema phagedenis]|uniref:Leucine-rich repeat domain-containing protein n=1 Tax=Treponema phagedenis TaxID=162 RepID=A0A0B7GRX1_TREPH|nr:leucine-rich repeat domain-containing protein [Treponema phagedenis]CEM61198.1 hypothetical protein TPHV1_150080 [Treponema phagedenis]